MGGKACPAFFEMLPKIIIILAFSHQMGLAMRGDMSLRKQKN